MLNRSTALAEVANRMRQARHMVAFTGAGISTPSGVPDFRSAGSGLWAQVDPMQAASLTAFRRSPQKFYEWLHPLVASGAAAQPNPAHLALARLEQAGRLQAVITQNIDNLHQRAGSHNVIHLHGSLQTCTCPGCQRGFSFGPFEQELIHNHSLPRCPFCSAILKPGITLYEEMLPAQAWEEASEHALQADLMLVIGTSLEVSPANHIPLMALQAGADLVINTRSTTFLNERAWHVFKDDVAEVLPLLTNQVIPEK